MSVWQVTESQESKNPLLNCVIQICQKISSHGKPITFSWIPSHRITGNEDAGLATKDVLSKAQPAHFELSCTAGLMKIQPLVSFLWHEQLDKGVGNKMHVIVPQVDDKYYSGCKNKNEEVIIRLRIGHTRLTHSFRMKYIPYPPLCDQCEGNQETFIIVPNRHLNLISACNT